MRPKAPPAIGQSWLTPDPVEPTLERGRPCLLFFWSMSCEASWSRLHELEGLAMRLPVEVIAVHSPRFTYEQGTEAVTSALARENVRLPVLHDPELLTWARYSPGGWPSVVLVDHRRRAIGASLGLDDLDLLADAVERAVINAQTAPSSTSGQKLPLDVATRASNPTTHLAPPADADLWWPSSIAIVGPSHVAVVDSGQDQVVVLELDAEQYSARPVVRYDGLIDARRVCRIDRDRVAVSQPGLGQVVALPLGSPDVDPQLIIEDLERPQGLALDRDGSLVVADAAGDQLIRCAIDGRSGPIAGTGFTGTSDGAAHHALLSQPVDVARTPAGLVFLDAATSNLRLLSDDGSVATVTNNAVEQYGLVDGPAHHASLQRPTAVALGHPNCLFIADTGNSRIRVLRNQKLTTLGLAGLRHPEDVVALPNGRLLVADTGNHRLVVVEPDGRAAWPLNFRGV